MHVEKAIIQNFKGIEELEVELGGRSVYVIGGNSKGKTSFISAIFSALTGKKLPPEPIKKGENEGRIEIELDDKFAVELKFKKQTRGKDKGKLKTTLSLYNIDTGEKIESPRTVLNSIIGSLDFNPFDFMALQPTPQLAYFCKSFGVNVKKLDDEYKELNELITISNKELNALEVYRYDKELANSELLSVSDLSEELTEAIEHNQEIDNFEERAQGVAEDLAEKEEELERLKEEIEELKEKDKAAKAWLKEAKKKDVDGLKKKMENIEEENDKIRAEKQAKEDSEKADQLEKDIEAAQADKEKIRKAKKKLIKDKIKHVDGLDFDGEVFLLDGLPFNTNQNNTAAQIIAGLKLGTGLLGDVKIARFEGSLLDNEHLEEVNQFAEKQGLQLFVELVDRDNGELRIEFTETT